MTIKISRAERPLADFYVEKQGWSLQAACKDLDPSIFFDECEKHEPTARRLGIKQARALCATCPVRRECGEQALLEEAHGSAGRYGVRGWMTPQQRESVHRRGGLRGRDPKRLMLGRDGMRQVPSIPDEGDQWSRHHTTLARKLCVWLQVNLRKGQRVPSTAKLCATLSCKLLPLQRVLEELVGSGVIEYAAPPSKKQQVYKYRDGASPDYMPKHLR